MLLKYSKILCFLALLTACQTVPRHTIETGVLRDQPGFIGSEIGAEVIGVYTSEDNNHRVIDIAVPDVQTGDIEVEVIEPQSEETKRGAVVEMLDDYEGGKVGIRVRLPENNRMEFRLRLIYADDAE